VLDLDTALGNCYFVSAFCVFIGMTVLDIVIKARLRRYDRSASAILLVWRDFDIARRERDRADDESHIAELNYLLMLMYFSTALRPTGFALAIAGMVQINRGM
jgi:hypothetical protein